ncbi:MAG TPA: glycosyltransferase family 4 protein [Methylomirabilota bacterium]|nr:glycosyltransferase family 4 protein [Methylomirabilota bacterium]
MTPPIRVLHVAESAGLAGGEAYLVRLATALDRRRFALTVVVPETGALTERLAALGVPTFVVPLHTRLLSPRTLWQLGQVFRRERPMIVQSHGARTNVYAKIAARLVGVPVVLATVHNSLFDYEVGALRRRLYVAAERLTGPLAHRVVAVSHAVGRDLVARYRLPAEQVVVIQNGIDPARFVPERPPAAARAELGLSPDTRLIGLVGRLTRQKGPDLLVAALPTLVTSWPQLRCLFVGDGMLGPELRRRAAALGLASHCVFLGPRHDVADLVAILDVVVLPSRSEGLPFALLEAMALAKPVVATRVGGNPEVVEDGRTGLLIPPEDPVALARAVLFLLDRPAEAAAMGRRGRERVVRDFSLTRSVGALQELYWSAASRAAGDGTGSERGRPAGRAS